MTSPRPVVLDTDIGSDVDDAMALALLLGTPELDLLGVTTVYGDTLLRARIARRYASLAGRDVPVHAGESAPVRDAPYGGPAMRDPSTRASNGRRSNPPGASTSSCARPGPTPASWRSPRSGR